ncbi:unnamed protein product [Effrenium voratum]|nr:unnamed protein product [Effrenium voratum]
MSLTSKIKEIEDTVSAGIHEVYSGLNRPDYDVPPELGGDSPTQINWLVFLVIFSVAASVALGLLLDARCRGKAMDGRPRFWSLLLLLTSYLLLIPGLTNPVFSFSIIINVIGHRKTVEPEEGHPVCTETAWSLAHLLWTTGSRIGAFLVILFSMVIPALELIMLVLGEMFRFTSARCAEVFRYVIMWVQHRSKWASPDMFAYVLLVNLVRTIQHDPLILARARLEIGFSCFSTFVVTATVSSLGIPLPQVKQVEDRPQAPIVLRYFGEKGVALVAGLLAVAFVPLFLHGLCSPCMSFHIEPKQLFPPYGPLPESAKPAIDILDLKDLLFSETSIVTCIRDYIARISKWEANTFISLALLVVCVVGSTMFDMICLVVVAFQFLLDGGYTSMNSGQYLIDTARVLRKLSMLDVAMVGVYLVTVCMSMYAKYGVVVSLENGTWILLAAEVIHAVTYHVVESACSHKEMERQELEMEPLSEVAPPSGCCSSRLSGFWLLPLNYPFREK